MPGSTDRGYPYPLGPEQALGSADIQGLAEAVDADVTSVSNPVGVIQAYAGATAPTGWLLCDGAAVSRTTYAALFAVCSTAYGAGNGSTTFNLPNFKGAVPAGYDSSQAEFNALGKVGGEKTHTLSLGEFPAHTHAQTAHAHSIRNVPSWPGGAGQFAELSYQGWNLGPTTVDGITATNTDGATTTGSAGTGGPHNNLQPYQVVNYIIRAL